MLVNNMFLNEFGSNQGSYHGLDTQTLSEKMGHSIWILLYFSPSATTDRWAIQSAPPERQSAEEPPYHSAFH